MTPDADYTNNPLHGVGLQQVVTEIVDHYGFEILHAYLKINCFKTNPSIESSVKFLKKTEWAREKVETFYLYQYKHLPRASADQFELPPRMRIIPAEQQPGEPAELSLEDAERLHEKRARRVQERDRQKPQRPRDAGSRHSRPYTGRTPSAGASSDTAGDPWSKWKK